MKKVIGSIALVSAFAAAASTVVQPVNVTKGHHTVKTDIKAKDWYLGGGIEAMSSRDSRVSMDIFNVKKDQDRLGNLDIVGGYVINEYLAVEGRYALSISDSDRVELSNRWSLFLKPYYDFDDEDSRAKGEDYWSVYALLGYGNTKLEGTNGVHADVDDGGFQWGIGVSYTFREQGEANDDYRYRDVWTIFADYTSVGSDLDGVYYNGARSVDADSFTVGLLYKF